MTSTPRHSVSVAAVVTDDQDRVLVIQRRDNGHWEIPGGVLELEETISDGVRREVAEETGLAIQPTRLTGIYKNIKLGVVALVFRAEAMGGAIQPTEESTQIAWFTLDEVNNRMGETFAIRVRDAVTGDGIALRTHDGVRIIDDGHTLL